MATRQLCTHVMGLDRATGKWFFLASDAKTRVYPGSPPSVMTPLPSTGIRLGAAGTARSITIPGHGQRRIYFSVGQALKFFSTPAAASSCRP
jgi:hypothetical protein